MNKKAVYVEDWSDEFWPTIKKRIKNKNDHSGEQAEMTFNNAKKEIIEQLKDNIKQIKVAIKNVQSLKKSDVKEEEYYLSGLEE